MTIHQASSLPRGLRLAALALVLATPLGCDASPERHDASESEGDQGSDDDLHFRFSTPLSNYPTLVTSMNTAAGDKDGGCWDTAPSGSVRPFQQYRCHAQDNQLWLFESFGGGFLIHSADDDDLCLDVPGFNTVSGQTLQMYPCNGGSNQIWSIVNNDSQSATIRPLSNSGLCLDVADAIQTEQATIQLYPCHGGDNQAWRFHDWAGSDSSLSCDWNIRFGPEVVSPGSRRSFPATGSHFNTLCSKNLQSDSVSCPSWSDWFVVDSPWGSDDFNVRCFNTF